MIRYFILSFFISTSCFASDLIYLTCDGVVRDGELNAEVKKFKNDFLIDLRNKTVQQIITGLTEEQTRDLRRDFIETETQFVTVDNSLSFNRLTLEYRLKGAMGFSISGICKKVEKSM